MLRLMEGPNLCTLPNERAVEGSTLFTAKFQGADHIDVA
jgi:hypothetical protein